MRERIDQIKRMTVRILIDGQPNGTGFVLSSDILIATCFHVVEHIQPSQRGQAQITYASSIQVEFSDENVLPATIHESCSDQNFHEALSKDYCILKVEPRNLVPIALGAFADSYEGAEVYLCGFPMGINQPVVSTGMFSTKWITNGYLNQGSNREVAWLDITMNKCNSGGPVVLIGNEPTEDKVIGIASFGLNPFAHPAEKLIQQVQTFPGNFAIMRVDFKKFASLVGEALASNSLGVGGCVSIDYLKEKLNT